MKKVRFFCFLSLLTVFPGLCYSAKKKSSVCKTMFANEGENFEDLFPFKNFVQLMVDLKIYSTLDLVKAKRDGDFPEEVPDKPLQTYPELEGKWSLLWDTVHALHLSQREDVAKRRKWTTSEVRAFIKEVLKTESRRNSQINKVGEHVPERQKKIGRKALSSHVPAALIAHNERLRKNQEEVLSLIAKNPQIKVEELAEQMQIPKRPTEQIISKLKEGGHLVRVGRTSKYGYWEVFKEGEKVSASVVSLQSERESKMLSLIAKNPQMKVGELAEKMQISERSARGIISKLKKEGRLVRVGGSSKYGYWEVL